MADRYVREYFNTQALAHANLGVKQMGIETGAYQPVWKRDTDTVRTYIGAVQGYTTDGSTWAGYSDNSMGKLTLHDHLDVDEYVRRDAGSDDYIRFQDGQISIHCTNTEYLRAYDTTINTVSVDPTEAGVGLAVGTDAAIASSKLTLYSSSAGPIVDTWFEDSAPSGNSTIFKHRLWGENDSDDMLQYAQIWAVARSVADGSESANIRIGIVEHIPVTPDCEATYLNIGEERYIGADRGLEFVAYDCTPHYSFVKRVSGGVGSAAVVGGFYGGGTDDANNEVVFCDAIVVSADDTENYVDGRWELQFSDDSVIDGNQLEIGHTTQSDVGAVINTTEAIPVIGTAANYGHGDTTDIGKLVAYGHDSAGADQLYASINFECVEDLAGSEEGLMELRVADPDNSGNQTVFATLDGSAGWLHGTSFIGDSETAIGAGGTSGSPTQQSATKKMFFSINPGSGSNDYFELTNPTNLQVVIVNNISNNTGYLQETASPTWETLGPNDWAIGCYFSNYTAWKWIVGVFP